MYSQIINPKTGRKVNVNGRLGRRIIRNYLVFLNGGAGPKALEAAKASAQRKNSDRKLRELESRYQKLINPTPRNPPVFGVRANTILPEVMKWD